MKPITRKEKILDAILSGDTDSMPTPITREETYLEAIAKNGSGGGGGIATVEGNPATAETDSAGIGVKTVVDIEPQQDLHGYDSPWVGGAGKNLSPTGSADASITVTEIFNDFDKPLASGDYVVSFDFVNVTYENVTGAFLDYYDADQANFVYPTPTKIRRVGDNAYMNTLTQPINGRFYYVTSGHSIGLINCHFRTDSYGRWTGRMENIQLERGLTPTSYEPYSNICPISGWDEANITVADDVDNPTVSNTYTIDFVDGSNPLTVYGGTLDVESGVLTVDRGFITFDGSEDEIISTYDEGEYFTLDYANFGDLAPKRDIDGIPTNRISPSATRMGNTAFELYWQGLPSDVRTVAALRTWLASNNLQVCYELATPYTISLTPHQIKLLQGVNNLSTNAHSVSLTYRKGKVAMNSDLSGLADSVNVLADEVDSFRKGKVAMNSDLEGLADSVNVLADEVDSFGIKPLTATALSDAVTISTFSAMKINKNVIFSCRVVITPTEEGSMPLFAINGVECPFEHTAKGTNSSRGIEGRWAIAQDTNILTWTVVSTELDKSNDILIQGVLAVK